MRMTPKVSATRLMLYSQMNPHPGCPVLERLPVHLLFIDPYGMPRPEAGHVLGDENRCKDKGKTVPFPGTPAASGTAKVVAHMRNMVLNLDSHEQDNFRALVSCFLLAVSFIAQRDLVIVDDGLAE